MRRPRALCTREEAKRLLPNYQEPTDATEQTNADLFFDDLIDSASQRMYEVSGREFTAYNDPGTVSSDDWPTPAPATRSFDVVVNANVPPDPNVSGGWRRVAVLRVGDLASLTSLAYGIPYDAARTTLDLATRVRATPLVRAPWEPIRALELRFAAIEGQTYDVTGVWGFPTVPADIRGACAEQVAIWANRDLAKYSATFLQAAAAGERASEPRSLVQSVYDTAYSYARIEV